MCGIAGILHWGQVPDAPARTRAMAAAIRHRGPDDEGHWSDRDAALGFVRLSILDLAGGHQPMANEDGTVWVVFNGEIYNHAELRAELAALGHAFQTDHSDTEVLVHGWEAWGEALPGRLNGMFAFAVWDQRQACLFLARDRYGIKPMYVAETADGSVLFASEIRAVHASALVPREANAASILEYFTLQNLWGTDTLFTGVSLFPAAHWERIERGRRTRRRYWDYSFARNSRLTLSDAAAQHREILQRVVKRQIAADVPVASYLSGGIDSSALCAAAHRLDPKMRAYSCIFDLEGVGDDKIVDEREFSRSVARFLDIEHVEMQLGQDALAGSLLPTIAALENPRMGMSYENYRIAERVARDGKVVLSGTGGDELHGGYVYRYRATTRSRPPRLFSRAGVRYVLEHMRTGGPARANAARILPLYLFLVAEAHRADAFTSEFLAATGEIPTAAARVQALVAECQSEFVWDALMYVDCRTYLHGLLVLEDKLSMASSLETRVPLLDNELVDFVCTLPWDRLFDGETGKIVFRESVKPLVPDNIYRKPKMGFGPPDASWYRGKLRPFIESRLSPRRVQARGVFRPDFVARTLENHFTGAANNVAMIWSLLSFDAWCEAFGQFGGALDS
jgi:asparagine synthase (glutamine-hydrolysing)